MMLLCLDTLLPFALNAQHNVRNQNSLHFSNEDIVKFAVFYFYRSNLLINVLGGWENVRKNEPFASADESCSFEGAKADEITDKYVG